MISNMIWMRQFLKQLIFLTFFWSGFVSAEPWISNRYAQNCAGCHAPGRRNLAPQDRRCTLSCQGCHVSPNGSGIRSQYGKWNEDHWLRSFRSDILANKKSFLPIKDQKYAKKPPNNMKRLVAQKGYPIRFSDASVMNEKNFDRMADGSEKITESYWDDWLFRIPEEDPYREMNRTKIDGGADVRWQVNQLKVDTTRAGGTTSNEKWQNFLMSADLYLRWRPIHKHAHLVYEGRYLGNPVGKLKAENIGENITKRSLYVLIDDLPYATYAQAGYYRPLFGNPTADHTALPQVMLSYALTESSRSYDLQYQTITVGGSPNVPFANFHILGKQVGAVANESHKGFATNLGGRFVTYGLSLTYSYWSTQKAVDQSGEAALVRTELQSFDIGAQIGPTTVTLDLVSISKDVPNEGFRQGGVVTLETYTALYRAIYGVFIYSKANTAETLDPGTGDQIRTGLRGFLFPGMDASLLFTQENQSTEKVDSRTEQSERKTSGLMFQFHAFM